MVKHYCMMPPHEEENASFEKASALFKDGTRRLQNAGVDEPGDFDMRAWLRSSPRGFEAMPTVREFRLLAIVCDFQDEAVQTPIESLDRLLNGDENLPAFKSVRKYYSDQSSGNFLINADIVRVTLPQPKAYYVDNQNGFGTFPKNSQGMFRDAILRLTLGGFNFLPYDNNGDGVADGILMIHAGSGAELTGKDTDIWSHRWAAPTFQVGTLKFSGYTTTPEYWRSPGDMTIGVVCHELGHEFGMPDLYIGHPLKKYCLMANGSWNGGLGQVPAGFCGALLMRLGFVLPETLQNFNGNLTLTGAHSEMYRLPVSSGAINQFYLLRFRKPSMWDQFVPSTPGLQIERVDMSAYDNRNPSKLLVQLMPADAVWGPDSGKDDLWPWTEPLESPTRLHDAFAPETVPSSNWIDGTPTGVSVRRIDMAPDASTLTARITTMMNPILGDVNGDGVVDIDDVWALADEVFMGAPPSGRGDINGDGYVDATDLQLLIDLIQPGG